MKAPIEKEEAKYQGYLGRHGLRYSHGRAIVFGRVMATHGHFTAEELAKVCAGLKPPVSRATVYRALQEMVEALIIRPTAFGDKHHHYEHLYDEQRHHHAQCVRCRAFIEFADQHEESVYETILRRRGFEVLGHEMHFYGICRDCAGGKRVPRPSRRQGGVR